MATSGQQVGVVSSTRGEVFAKNEAGQVRRLNVGDPVFQNDVIVTANGSAAEISMTNGGPDLSVAEQQTVALDTQVSAVAPDATAGSVTELGSSEAAKVVQTAAAQGLDALIEDDATAAGGEAGDAGSSFVDLMRIVEAVPGAAYDFPLNPTGAAPNIAGQGQVQDGLPSAGDLVIALDEDDLQGGEKNSSFYEAAWRGDFEAAVGYPYSAWSWGNNDEQPGDDVPVNSLTTLSGTLNFSYGPDGVGNLIFNLPVETLTSGGETVHYWVSADGHALVAYTQGEGREGGTTIIFTAEITDVATGAFSFTLYGPLDHAITGTEDNLTVPLSFTVTDRDGDSATGTLTLNLDDDSPVVNKIETEEGVQDAYLSATAEEDDLSNGNNEDGSEGAQSTTGYVQYGEAVRWGADGFGSVSGFDVGEQHFEAGSTIYWAKDGSFLGADGEGAAAQLVVNADGSYTFTVLSNLLLGQGVQGEQMDYLGQVTIRATDRDGDPVSVNLQLNVEDDIPVATKETVSATVAENDIKTYLSLGSSPNDGNADGSYTGDAGNNQPGPATVSGSVSSLVSLGADGGTFSLSLDNASLPEVSSKGVSITYSLDGDTLVAKAGNRTVFTLTVDSEGDYTFKLYDQLDHPKGQGTNNLPLDLSSVLVATDGDGDVLNLSSGFTINITDDVPTAVNDYKTITEDTQYINGNVLSNDVTGADDPLSFSGWAGAHHGVIQGEYGYLIDTGNGTYKYVLNTASVQSLDDGESRQESFNYTVKDADGDPSPATLVITIEGKNDRPEITVNTGECWGGDAVVYESAMAIGTNPNSNGEYATGTFKVSDPDGLDDIKSINFSTAGEPGLTFTVGTGGLGALVGKSFETTNGTVEITGYNAGTGTFSYKFTLTSPTDDVPYRDETNSFKITVSDGDATDSATVTIKIVDDAPEVHVSGPYNNSIAEDAPNMTGNWSAKVGADQDGSSVKVVVGGQEYNIGQAITVTQSGQTLGVLTVNANGTWSFDPSLNIDNHYNPSFTFAVKAVDGDNDSDSDSYTIRITDGANPRNAAAVSLSLDEEGLASGSNPGSGNTDQDTLSFTAGSDALTSFKFSTDLNNLIKNTDSAYGNELVWVRDSDSKITAHLGSASGDVAITLTLTAPVGGIAAGQSGSVQVNVTLSDNLKHATGSGEQSLDLGYVNVVAADHDGDSATGKVSLSVKDDVPTLQSDDDYVKEDASVRATGNVLTGADVANGDGNNTDGSADKLGADGGTVTGIKFANGTEYSVPANGSKTVAGLYGTLTLKADGSYEYQLDASKANPLQEGDKRDEVFTYRVKDGDGDEKTTTLTIHIEGTNDKPEITFTGNNDKGTVIEAGNEDNGTLVPGTPSVSGTLTVNDVDDATGFVWTVVGTPNSTYGTFSLDAATGKWTYALNNALTATQALEEGQSVPLTFTVRVTDPHGASDDQTISVTVKGTNDSPVITDASTVSGSVTEDDAQASTATGQLYATDVDANETQTWSVQGSSQGTYGSLSVNATTGKWTYTLDNSLAATQALNSNDTKTETFTVRVLDKNGAWDDQQVTVQVHGVDDNTPPTVQDVSGSGVQAGAPVAVTLSGSDADGSVHHFVISNVPAHGVLKDGNGNILTAGSTVTADANGKATLYFDGDDSFDTTNNNGGNPLTFNYTAVDDGGLSSGQATASITISDVGPVAKGEAIRVVEAGQSTVFNANVVLTLDYSTSMGSSERSSMEDAAIKLLNEYKSTLDGADSGNVKVLVVKFGSTATSGGWMTIGDAISYINQHSPLSGTQYTNYDAALKELITKYSLDGKVTADGTINTSYFLTDGDPTLSNLYPTPNRDGQNEGVQADKGDGINPGYATGTNASSTTYIGTNGEVGQGNWEAFLKANDITSYAIGMGSSPSSSGLEPIAYNGVTEQQDHSNLLQLSIDFDKLGELLVGTLPAPILASGNVLSNDAPGADGWASQKISAVWLDDGDGVKEAGEASATLNGNIYTVTLPNNFGTVTINRLTGEYQFTGNPDKDIGTDVTFNIGYTVKDADGSEASTKLVLSLVDRSEVRAYDNQDGARVYLTEVPGTVTTTVLADFSSTSNQASSGQNYNPWIFDTTDNLNVSGDERTVIDGNTNVLAYLNVANKWVSSSLVDSFRDANVYGQKLEIADGNDRSSGAGELLTPEFVTGAQGNTKLTFTVSSANTHSNDVVTWTLYKLEGSTWQAQTGSGLTGTISNSTSSVTTGDLEAGAHYRVYFSVKDGGNMEARWIDVDNFKLVTTMPDRLEARVETAVGNVLTDGNTLPGSIDNWGAVDSKGSEGATLSILNGGSYAEVTGSVTVHGTYGDLLINSDGSYVYTPIANFANVGQQEVFTYKLTQPDGDFDTASLVIKIGASSYTDPVVFSGSDSNNTMGGDASPNVFLGNGGNDTIYGFGGNDHIEGGAGNDNLQGDNDNDVLIGGAGNDTLYGGSGADTFVFRLSDTPNGTQDTVKDFQKGSDVLQFEDVLSISLSFSGGNTTIQADYGNNVVQTVVVENVDLTGAGTQTHLQASTDHIIKITG